jgi:hypothetical protein
LLIVLSLVLSANIWLNPSKNIQPTANLVDNKSALESTRLKASEVYLPMNIIFHDNGVLSWPRGENLISNVQGVISDGKFSKFEYKNLDDAAYKNLVSIKNGIELMYEGEFDFKEYSSAFSLKLKSNLSSKKNFYFRRILIDFDKKQMYFMNDKKNEVLEGTVSLDSNDITYEMKKTTTVSLPVVLSNDNMPFRYAINSDITLKKYSYILSSQPYSNFRDAFFNNINNISTNESTQSIVYLGDNDESMSVDESSGQVTFRGIMSEDEASDNVFQDSYAYASKLGKFFTGLRYFSMKDSKITYRTFVEGFPLFSRVDKGKVEVEVTNGSGNEKNVRIVTNLDTIEVPIPSDETVTLPPSQTVMDNLVNAGAKTSDITSLVLGYSWGTVDQKNQVVDLSPDWFILYKGEWITYDTLMNNLGGEG